MAAYMSRYEKQSLRRDCSAREQVERKKHHGNPLRNETGQGKLARTQEQALWHRDQQENWKREALKAQKCYQKEQNELAAHYEINRAGGAATYEELDRAKEMGQEMKARFKRAREELMQTKNQLKESEAKLEETIQSRNEAAESILVLFKKYEAALALLKEQIVNTEDQHETTKAEFGAFRRQTAASKTEQVESYDAMASSNKHLQDEIATLKALFAQLTDRQKETTELENNRRPRVWKSYAA